MLKDNLQRKKWIFPFFHIWMFCFKRSLQKKMMWSRKCLWKIVHFLILKNHLPLQFVKNVWLKHLVLQLCLHVQFLSQFFFSHIVLPKLVEKTKETYVLPLLNECYCVTANFDLWMFKGAHDVFAMIIFFLGSD